MMALVIAKSILVSVTIFSNFAPFKQLKEEHGTISKRPKNKVENFRNCPNSLFSI